MQCMEWGYLLPTLCQRFRGESPQYRMTFDLDSESLFATSAQSLPRDSAVSVHDCTVETKHSHPGQHLWSHQPNDHGLPSGSATGAGTHMSVLTRETTRNVVSPLPPPSSLLPPPSSLLDAGAAHSTPAHATEGGHGGSAHCLWLPATPLLHQQLCGV